METAEDVKRIVSPMLVLCGALDAGSTPAMARRLVGAVASAKLVIVPRQGHMLPIEAAGTVSSALRAFMSALN